MQSYQFNFDAIGTHWVIDVDDAADSIQEKELLEKIKSRIDEFDRTYSRFRDDSYVSLISKKASSYKMPSDAKPLLDLYKTLFKLTNGAMTPLIGDVLEQAGYDSKYSFKPKKMTSPVSFDEALSYNFHELNIKRKVLLDFGAAGKGYLVDIIGKLLKDLNISSFCVDAGGDILHEGQNSIKVGLENPVDFKQVVGVVDLKNKSICGSAGNRRKWSTFHHIINPHTLTSPTNILSVWVVAESALIADGLATALFFVNAEKLKKNYSFEYVLLFSDFTFEISSHFPGELYTIKR